MQRWGTPGHVASPPSVQRRVSGRGVGVGSGGGGRRALSVVLGRRCMRGRCKVAAAATSSSTPDRDPAAGVLLLLLLLLPPLLRRLLLLLLLRRLLRLEVRVVLVGWWVSTVERVVVVGLRLRLRRVVA